MILMRSQFRLKRDGEVGEEFTDRSTVANADLQVEKVRYLVTERYIVS